MRSAANAQRSAEFGPGEISVVVPVSERFDSVQDLYRDYKQAVSAAFPNVEFIYVLDGKFEEAGHALRGLQAAGEPIRIVRLTRHFGEATAIAHGVEHARFDPVLLLPAYYQVEPTSLTAFVRALDDQDIIVARRWPRIDSWLNRAGTVLFHAVIRFVTGYRFRDVGCGVRLVRRKIFEEITLYGDQHRFLAILAAQRGFRVREQDLPQARQDPKVRVYRPSVYLRRVLDLLAVFFLVRFTKRPLRFFGLIGSTMIGIGLLVLASVITERIFFEYPLADRPALLLGALFLVLGVQLFAVGLIGELVIFTHARELKDYAVAETVNFEPQAEGASASIEPSTAASSSLRTEA